MKIKATAFACVAMAGAAMGTATPAAAQSEPLIGQLIYVGFTFCPRGWAMANGQTMSIAQNQALFSLLGTSFGGDGQTTFGLPDLRGRVPLGQGQSPGNSSYTPGEMGGSETNILNVNNLPAHSHTATLRAHDVPGTSDNPTGTLMADFPEGQAIYAPGPADVSMAADAIQVGNTGGNAPVNNMQPFTTLTACIATVGIYPSRN